MSAVEVAEKTCTKCGETKPLTGFHRNRRMKDGRHSWCKNCMNKAVKAAQARRREAMGEDTYRELLTKRMRQYRRMPEYQEGDRLQSRAWNLAQTRLREAHPEQWAALLRQARYELGLPVD